MGEVYKGRDTRLDRTVAVKVLPSHMSVSPELRQRFEREAKAISQLSHSQYAGLFSVLEPRGNVSLELPRRCGPGEACAPGCS
jgi:serine/threonine protein kinase